MSSTYTIDRFEGELAVLEAADGSLITVPRARIPAAAVEGDVVERVTGGTSGVGFRLLPAATDAARAEAASRLRRLRGRDPGGDVSV